MTVQRPTLAQMKDVVVRTWNAHVGRPRPGIPRRDARHPRRLRCRRCAARLPAAGALSAHIGLPPDGGGKPDERLVREDRNQGCAARSPARAHGGAQGQCLPRRRADDERRRDLEGLHARHRRNDRHAPARRRCDHRRQGALRVFLPVRRKPHQRDRAGPQSAQARLFRRWIVVRFRRAGRRGPRRHGHWRRPGRIDPHAGFLLRRLWNEADARPRSLYRHHADRGHHRPHRPDDAERHRQRADAGSDSRRRRAGPAPVRREDRPLYGRRQSRRFRPSHRRRQGRLRTGRRRSRCRCKGARGSRALPHGSALPSTRSRCHGTSRGWRSGRR